MKIYLDIDETILRNDLKVTEHGWVFAGGPAAHLKEFLKNILKRHDVYWLTTHCDGDPSVPVLYLSKFFDEELMQLIIKIKPTRWKNMKVEAINLDEDFLWFDDCLFDTEKKILENAGKLKSHVMVNLDKNPDFYKDFLGA
ncbi:hypothetical protein A2V49_00710 [candidate division WWE3 bacterium RBG_19FT_COMBO_34_6]|uniref:FCP1 homology domain-containing protein n=1 Tax=candidate division WWE3 bacterium RBG_19FT_COMBO_34_6 TaxID=1802612 RepID=A0A1F4UK72_UNCKA|nr:MAG: hypothetical protein A2V49_00710 [candidate division WWE3 bacterium RBG_19FT_COMBO_34_6]